MFTAEEIAQIIADAIENDEDASDAIDITAAGIRFTPARYNREAHADFIVTDDDSQLFRVTVTPVTD